MVAKPEIDTTTKRSAKLIVGAVAVAATVCAAALILDLVPVGLAWAYYQHLCRTQAKDAVYRSVDNVEGLFQVRPRDPRSWNELASKRFGMEDPYGFALGDRDKPWRYFLGYGTSDFLEGRARPRYSYFETRVALSPTEGGSRYVRHEAALSGTYDIQPNAPKPLTRPEYKILGQKVDVLKSRYGYEWEDTSSWTMRLLWIAGGRMTVIDLDTKEVLAERVGFLFARYRNGSRDVYAWLKRDDTCPPARLDLVDFVSRVLRPVP